MTKRENTGAGFFTGPAVDRAAAPPGPLTVSDFGEVAEIDGFVDPLLLLVFVREG